MLQCLTTWLQSQGITRPIALTSGLAALLHPAVNWLLIVPCGLGALGSAVANAVTQMLWLGMLLCYAHAYGVTARVGLRLWSLDALRASLSHNLWPFVQVCFFCLAYVIEYTDRHGGRGQSTHLLLQHAHHTAVPWWHAHDGRVVGHRVPGVFGGVPS